jgi:hypothetical protein
MKLGKMLSVGEVVEHSVPEEPSEVPSATVEQPAPAASPVEERAPSTPAPTPAVASIDR